MEGFIEEKGLEKNHHALQPKGGRLSGPYWFGKEGGQGTRKGC